MVGASETSRAAAPDHTTTVAVVVSLLVLVATTRLLTGRTRSSTGGGGNDAPSMPPYWVPFLGHVPQVVLGFDGFLSGLMKRYPEGIFSLMLVGKVHNFISRPSLATLLMNQPESVASSNWLHLRLVYNVFGYRRSDGEDLIRKTYDVYHVLSSTRSLNSMTEATVSTLNQNIADWVTFNSQPADQMEWEQVAGADVVSDGNGGTAVEVDLMELTRAFVARVATPSVFGTDFCDNFPDFAQHIWQLDQNFALLAFGLPGWIPYRPLQLARAAKRKLLAYLEEFHTQMDRVADGEDPDPRWENLDNVSAFLKARLDVYRRERASIRARAAIELGALWAMNANSAPLVFWMLYEISRDPVLLEQIREEIAPYMHAVQPRNDFGLAVWMAPELRNVDIDGLMEKCPLLKASYVETLRLYTGSYTIKWMSEDAVLGKPSDAAGGGYLLRKGTYAHAAHDLHQLDPESYPDPHEWQPARHLKKVIGKGGQDFMAVDLGTIRPYGGGAHMCKGRAFAARELMIFTAAILSLYDIQPPTGHKWGNQKPVKATSTKRPARPVKAWVRRREVPQEV